MEASTPRLELRLREREDEPRLALPGGLAAEAEPAALGERDRGGVARVDDGDDLGQTEVGEAVGEQRRAELGAEAAAASESGTSA